MQRYFIALADANLCKVIEEINLKTSILMRVNCAPKVGHKRKGYEKE